MQTTMSGALVHLVLPSPAHLTKWVLPPTTYGREKKFWILLILQQVQCPGFFHSGYLPLLQAAQQGYVLHRVVQPLEPLQVLPSPTRKRMSPAFALFWEKIPVSQIFQTRGSPFQPFLQKILLV